MTLTPGNPMRVVLLSILLFEVVVYGLAIPVMILVSDVAPAGRALGGGGGAAAAGPGRGRHCCAEPVGLSASAG